MPQQHKVQKLPRDPGIAGWNAILPKAAPPRILDGNIAADWVVIGGGFAGLAAARRLTQLRPADKVVLLEALRVGEGPAGRNTGFMIDLPHELNSDGYAGPANADLKQIRMNRAAIDFAREAAEEYGLYGSVFQDCGKHNAAATEKGIGLLKSYASHLRNLGEPFEELDTRAMKALTGTDFYQSGLYTSGTAMIQPAAYVRGVAAGLSDKADIYESSPVTALEPLGLNGTALYRLETPEGSVTTPHVILAVNGHAQSFGFYRHRLMHVFTYASMTRRLTEQEIKSLGGEKQWNIIPADPMGTTIRRTADDRIVVRNRFTYNSSMEVTTAAVEQMGRDHDSSFQARFPMLKTVSMEYRWGGRLCLSLNSVPAFGEIETGIFSAVCQNGLGTVKGTLSGMLAADLAAKGNCPMVADMLGYDAPKRLPPDFLMDIGANAVLRWKEYRAGREL